MHQTRPHLSQIQSTDSEKHPHLLDEVLEILGNVDYLLDVAVVNILDSYDELNKLEGKKVGFYKVVKDETYRNNPTEYYFDGDKLHFLTEKIPSEALKKTAVFYIKRLASVNQKVSILIPYTGVITDAMLYIPNISQEDLVVRIDVNGRVLGDITLPQGKNKAVKSLLGFVNHEVVTITVLSGELQLEGINLNIDFVPKITHCEESYSEADGEFSLNDGVNSVDVDIEIT